MGVEKMGRRKKDDGTVEEEKVEVTLEMLDRGDLNQMNNNYLSRGGLFQFGGLAATPTAGLCNPARASVIAPPSFAAKVPHETTAKPFFQLQDICPKRTAAMMASGWKQVVNHLTRARHSAC